MTVESISAINTKQAASRFSKYFAEHKFTKASLDAPIDSELKKITPANVRANYFPFDSSTGKIEKHSENIKKSEPEYSDFISQTALACQIKK